jgi:hypothetical protein
MLAMACGIIVLSFVLVVRSDEHAACALLPGWPIPSTCPSQSIFGIDCPGCGLTRSFIFLAHGDWHNAFLRNRMGWLLAFAVLLQLPYRLIALRGPNRMPLGRRIPQLFGMVLIVGLIGNWAYKMLGMSGCRVGQARRGTRLRVASEGPPMFRHQSVVGLRPTTLNRCQKSLSVVPPYGTFPTCAGSFGSRTVSFAPVISRAERFQVR